LLANLSSSREQDRETNGLISAPGTRTPSAARQTIESAADSEIGPNYHKLIRKLSANELKMIEFAISAPANDHCRWMTTRARQPWRHAFDRLSDLMAELREEYRSRQ
jgi:hypothetical protein